MWWVLFGTPMIRIGLQSIGLVLRTRLPDLWQRHLRLALNATGESRWWSSSDEMTGSCNCTNGCVPCG